VSYYFTLPWTVNQHNFDKKLRVLWVVPDTRMM